MCIRDRPSDFEPYFNNSFCPSDKEVIRLTGSKEKYTKAEVKAFFQNAIKNEDFYLFLILSPNQDIIGEVVINEIDHSCLLYTSTRDIASTLFNICIISIWKFTNKFICLCQFTSFYHFFITGIWIPPAKIFLDCSRE